MHKRIVGVLHAARMALLLHFAVGGAFIFQNSAVSVGNKLAFAVFRAINNVAGGLVYRFIHFFINLFAAFGVKSLYAIGGIAVSVFHRLKFFIRLSGLVRFFGLRPHAVSVFGNGAGLRKARDFEASLIAHDFAVFVADFAPAQSGDGHAFNLIGFAAHPVSG